MTRIDCLIDGALALTVVGSWPLSNQVDSEMDAALAGIRLLSRPVASFPTTADPEARRPSVKRPPLDASAWSDLRAAWRAPDAAGVEVGAAARWSPVELAVCAAILGAASFPTVGPELLASLPTASLNATLDAVTRSFIARGLVRAHDDGWATLCDGPREVMEGAVFPDLTISIERLSGGGAGHWWFGLRPDQGVQVTVLPDGSRECGSIHPGRLIDQVFAVTGTGKPTGGEAPAGADPGHVTLADVVGGASRVAALLRVNTAWRVGTLIRGGVFTWALGVDGSLWLADPVVGDEPPSWKLGAIDLEGLGAELLDHLPGA